MKYSTEVCSITDCPPASSDPGRKTAYRLIFDPASADAVNNFLPPGIQKPERVDDEQRSHLKCSFFAISMFTTKDKALKHYEKLKGRNPMIHLRLGSFIAEGDITPSDGVISAPNKHGHFDLHESKSADLAKSFKVLEKLPIPVLEEGAA